MHREPALTSTRHLLSWALFAFSAGAVNAGALLACERFVAHVTGTVTRIGLDAGSFLAIDYALVFFAFIAGAMTAVLIARKANLYRQSDHERRTSKAKSSGSPVPSPPPYWIPLTLVAALLVLIALTGTLGWFGPFGGTVETKGDFVLLGILSFAMGTQNATVAVSTGMAVRTTHMTGPTTDIAVALATLLTGSSEERRTARSSLILRGAKLMGFVLGAAIMALVGPRITWLAFLLPAVTLLVATVRSYGPNTDADADADTDSVSNTVEGDSSHVQVVARTGT